jgi:hypothetical protein
MKISSSPRRPPTGSRRGDRWGRLPSDAHRIAPEAVGRGKPAKGKVLRIINKPSAPQSAAVIGRRIDDLAQLGL